MADKLTPQQEQAVFNRGGNLLVSAAAGSGKTKVLVDRLLTYLTDPINPANLDEFLIITYTKAAASELRGKIAAKLSERIAAVPENMHLQKQMQRLFLTKISTVHGFCGDLLREYAYQLNIPVDFRIGDESECREIRDTVLSDLLDRAYEQEHAEDFHAFVDTQGLGRDDRLVPQIIEKVYDSARCHLDPEAWLQSCLEAAQVEHVQDVSETVWGRYLMEDLQAYLEQHIRILEQCAGALERSDGLEKPAMNIRATIAQLKELQTAQTWDEIVQKRSIDYGRLTFPKKTGDAELCDRVKMARNSCKEGLSKKLSGFTDKSSSVLQDLMQSAAGVRGLILLVHQFDRDYSAAKRSRRMLDFSDLEHKTLDLLLGKNRSHPTVAANEIGQRYREILVDEYQDSNGVQDKIFEALTWERQNCFLVGDVKQSIYQFRLADPGIFLQKYHQYVSAEDAAAGQGRKVLLSHNFRSGPEVIDAVNHVFSACMRPEVGGLYYGDAEALREGVAHEVLKDTAVELYGVDVQEETYPEEAAFVAERIHQMLSEGVLVRKNGGMQPVKPEDIVILLRSPGSAAMYFQSALEARGIRCASGSGTDLLKTEEISTFRALLKTIMNPRQDIPLLSTLASPVFGFTAEDIAVIRSRKKKGFIYDALTASEHPKATAFLRTLDQLRACARMDTLTNLLEQCLTLTRLDSIYSAMSDGETKSGNLQTFFRLASDFEKGNLRDLSQFLDHLDALEERGLVGTETANAGCITIMSIHKSKGLEFPVVFLCNLSRKFNLESARAQILCDKELGLGLSVADTVNRVRYPSLAKRAIGAKMISESISEEMRVLYVAMTRARDRLIMTYASQTLQKDLEELALRQDFDDGALLCTEALCMGDWVLLAALRRTEAGTLHVLGGKPDQTQIGAFPWKIQVVEAPVQMATAELQAVAPRMPDDMENRLRRALSFRYAHESATRTPSKRTATDRKGRIKDMEAAERAPEPQTVNRLWRKPAFLSKQIDGKAYGNAVHAAMQYICYKNCSAPADVSLEIQRLIDNGFLSEEQGNMVNAEDIAKFFASEIGGKLQKDVPHLREFKFSILDEGNRYGENLEGEQVLLQGVVDCALVEPDGITIIDFKTDHVTNATLQSAAERYRDQLETYAEAMSRIFEMPVKAKYLYFFQLDQFVKI
ncbi:MAG: helicase-exonuclease AddAB subunit AddA [Oscillospiraceae bacterium]|nr:helicase-exonuclease AddAB subunit AddA [Oscillospiraceae bacterium]